MMILIVDHDGLMAVTDPGWELGGERTEEEQADHVSASVERMKSIPREIPHTCGLDGNHRYDCVACGWLPF